MKLAVLILMYCQVTSLVPYTVHAYTMEFMAIKSGVDLKVQMALDRFMEDMSTTGY